MKKGVMILLGLTILTAKELVGQKLIDFSYSECSNNPYVGRMNPVLQKMNFKADGSLDLWFTWVTGCSFDPKLALMEVKGDTIHFDFEFKTEDNPVSCSCEYPLRFKIANIKRKDYQIKIFKYTIDKNAKRYWTDGYAVEYFEPSIRPQKSREIFSLEGKIIVEVFYDKEGNMTAEKFYHPGFAVFNREVKY
jgi:hypothetical protein